MVFSTVTCIQFASFLIHDRTMYRDLVRP